EIGFFATTVGPTEVFRFSPVANEQFKIIGHNGLVLARPETAGESVERRQAFDPWLVTGKALGVVGGALRGSHGKYVAIGQDGSRLVFDACFPSRTPHSALFLLERVSGQGAADEPSERAQWNLGPKVLDLPRGRSLFNE
ncbi:MAG: hypothetical protein FJY85_14210, partial [Deltaproteobacteria bacterium]|nr:hypothetical protein [Deltaproteobacteria bacterium]